MTATAPPADPARVDAYISSYPAAVQEMLRAVRAVIARAVPGSTEHLSYGMPTVTVDGVRVVYYAAWKRHLGLYPIPRMSDELESEIARFRAAKDSLNFPYKRGVPLELIERVVRELVRQRG